MTGATWAAEYFVMDVSSVDVFFVDNMCTENLGRFHHAVTQTAPIQKKDVHIIRFHREAGSQVDWCSSQTA